MPAARPNGVPWEEEKCYICRCARPLTVDRSESNLPWHSPPIYTKGRMFRGLMGGGKALAIRL